MKYKFQRLTKEEKKEIIQEYKNTDSKKKYIFQAYLRVKILCVAGLIFSLFSFGFDIYLKAKLYSFIGDGFLLIACLLSFYKFQDMYFKELNDFLLEKDKKSTKSKEKKTSKSKVKKNKK